MVTQILIWLPHLTLTETHPQLQVLQCKSSHDAPSYLQSYYLSWSEIDPLFNYNSAGFLLVGVCFLAGFFRRLAPLEATCEVIKKIPIITL